MQRRTAEESHFDVVREGMDAEEPALALDSVKRRLPYDCLAEAGDGAHDERVEAAPNVALAARHGRDVGPARGRRRRLSRSEGCRLRGGPALRPCGLRLRCRLARFGRLRSDPLGGGLRRLLGRLAGHVFTPL
jgi:hypothetical protein